MYLGRCGSWVTCCTTGEWWFDSLRRYERIFFFTIAFRSALGPTPPAAPTFLPLVKQWSLQLVPAFYAEVTNKCLELCLHMRLHDFMLYIHGDSFAF